ncbi:uncharacterized protein isoform X2 [Rhodnius prolixus]|uniref:uncharacterized protein isoform X2 n=1 Tax=Rhodnius prolixus TaxID=13249 RepID=UPI003D18F205
MQLFQVIWVTLMLLDGLWGLTRQEEFKTRRVSTVTLRRTETKKEKNQRHIENQSQKESDEDEDKKTLSQQVADGKYGLIQRELFSEPIKRPGIISYEVNPEVPKDNVNNLGGLMPEEIWLAENHLLVLKGGGSFGGEGNWPAIDNYVAPRRQVKIPHNPKVPPPFPVQLKDNGPTEFIRSKNGSAALPVVPFFNGLYPVNETFPGNLRAGNGFDPFPLLLPLPPPVGTFLPRPENLTELDEDDPSIYYPPPYDFYFPKDNSSFVPPGPLVPGIVVPPPPNFFGLLEKKSRTKGSNVKPKTTTTQSPPRLHTTTGYPSTTSKPNTQRTIAHRPHKTTPATTTVSPNEIVHTLPPDTPVGNWIPIPAPRPFYISLKSIKLHERQHQPGWRYYNTTEKKMPRIYNPEPYYYSGFKPIINPNPIPVYVENFTQKPKYYFYDPPEYETNTLSPSLVVKTSPRTSKYVQSPLEYFLRDKYGTNKKSPATTTKPPIYEYSYSAPGYGTLEAPKIGNNFVTSKQPYLYEVSTVRPYSYNVYQTEYPTYTQSPRPLVDLPKKYFTSFGQKLNHEVTSPKYNNKFVTTTPKNVFFDYNLQNDGQILQDQYYEEKLYYRPTNKPKSYPQFYRAPNSPHYVHNYNRQNVVAGHPLDTDIRVNYKNPLPPINPDAEFIGPFGGPTTPGAPHQLPRGTSLISYQLPGTGGHFYFLTPQAVK